MEQSKEKKDANKSLLTVKSIENPCGGYYVLRAKTEEGITWTPGQFGLFTLPNNTVEGKQFRAFSIASTVKENDFMLGFRTGEVISDFKKQMIALKEGDKVLFNGPKGSFTIKDSTNPVVFIAGGVGITPIRALIKQVEHDTSRPIELLYASSDFYLFGDEIGEIAKNNEQFKIHKTKLVDDTQEKLKCLLNKYCTSGCFYISGAPRFIEGIKETVKKLGVSDDRIVYDTFFGY